MNTSDLQMLPIDSLYWEALIRWRNCHLINKTLIMKYISHNCGFLTIVVLQYHETEVSSSAASPSPWSFSYLSKTREGLPRQDFLRGICAFPGVESVLGDCARNSNYAPAQPEQIQSGPVCSLQICVTLTFLSLSALLKDFSPFRVM